MSAANNKPIVKKAQELLKEYGHDVKTGHLYEIFSKLAGENTWNIANSKNVSFSDKILAEILELEDLIPNNYSAFVNLSREAYLQSVKNTSELLMLGTAKESKQPYMANFLTAPNALFVGGMGSGKTIAALSVVAHFLQSNPNRSTVFIIDNLMGATDYKNLFSLPNVYPVVNSDTGVHRVVDLIHDELMARKDAFIKLSAENYLDYEKKTGKTINRCLIAIENFHAVIEPVLMYSLDSKTALTSANKFKDILRMGRALGVFIIASSQRATKSDIPPEVLAHFTHKAIFRVNKEESMYLTNSLNSSTIGVGDKGQAYIDNTLVQFPHFSEEEWKKMLFEFKTSTGSNLFLTKKIAEDYLKGKSTQNIYELKSDKALFSNLRSYDTKLVLKVLLEKQEYTVNQSTVKGLDFSIEKDGVSSQVLITSKIKAKDLEKLCSTQKDGFSSKLFLLNEEATLEEYSLAKSMGVEILDLEQIKELLVKE